MIIHSYNKIVFAILFSVACLLLNQSNSMAETKLNLKDPFLEEQCDWAMYLDVQDIQSYLNYEKSRLHPLTRVRVSYRAIPKSGTAGGDSTSKPYEMLWYFKRTPVGMDRLKAITFVPQSLGMVVLGPSGENGDHCASLTNALLRLLVDLQFKDARVSTVLVPDGDFEQVVAALGYYHFSEGLKVKVGAQMNIHLCSSTSNKEKYLFLGK